jgi:hypothetical protein
VKREAIIKKMLTPMWALHIVIDAGLVLGYYVYVNPPSAATALTTMSAEFVVILGAADIVTHYVLGYD